MLVDVFDFDFYGDAKGGRLRSGDGNRMLGYAEFAEAAACYRQQLDTHGFRHTHLWSTENGTPSGTWLEPPQQRLTVTEAEQARDLPNPAVAFPVTPVAVSGGMATLTLGAEPVYVRAE